MFKSRSESVLCVCAMAFVAMWTPACSFIHKPVIAEAVTEHVLTRFCDSDTVLDIINAVAIQNGYEWEGIATVTSRGVMVGHSSVYGSLSGVQGVGNHPAKLLRDALAEELESTGAQVHYYGPMKMDRLSAFDIYYRVGMVRGYVRVVAAEEHEHGMWIDVLVYEHKWPKSGYFPS